MEYSNKGYNDDSDFENEDSHDSTEPVPAQNPSPHEVKERSVGGELNDLLVSSSTNQRFISKDTERLYSTINLSNFDPFESSQRINSPRSLEVCFKNGIDIQSLYHKSYDAIKGNKASNYRNMSTTTKKQQ